MRISLVLCMFLVCGSIRLPAQPPLRFMTYNVENLFDTKPDSGKMDTEFLPESPRHWTPWRYWRKLNRLAQTIVAVGNGYPPAFVALCEVENDSVLHDLTCRSSLRAVGYRYVMTDSPDRRGIDVALLWQPERFRRLSSYGIRIPSAENGFKPTRDILYVKGQLVTGDTLHILVCHLPSRAGGIRSAQEHRRLALSMVRRTVDSLSVLHPDALVLVAGDLNSYPDEKILRETLSVSYGKTRKPSGHCILHSLTTRQTRGLNATRGTYRYQGEWSCLDHILVSPALYEGRGTYRASRERTTIADFPFLLEPNITHGGLQPFRTYRGPAYHDGYSDHLPLYTDLFNPK